MPLSHAALIEDADMLVLAAASQDGPWLALRPRQRSLCYTIFYYTMLYFRFYYTILCYAIPIYYIPCSTILDAT